MENKCVNALYVNDEFESDSEESISVTNDCDSYGESEFKKSQESYFKVKNWEEVGMAKYITVTKSQNIRAYLDCDENIPGWSGKAMEQIKFIHKESVRLKAEQKKRKDPSYYLFITLRPQAQDKVGEKVEFDKFKAHVDKLMGSAFFAERCDWCFEQKGETFGTLGQGYHCHIMYKKHEARSGRNLIRTAMVLDKISRLAVTAGIKYGDGNQGIDIQSKWYKWYEKQIAYMEGDKGDPEKMKAVKCDKVWRVRNQLSKMYKNYE